MMGGQVVDGIHGADDERKYACSGGVPYNLNEAWSAEQAGEVQRNIWLLKSRI
jgi:hypothetical protein